MEAFGISGGIYDWSTHNTIRDYVMGGHIKSSIPWVDVDYVYIPMQVPVLDHWVLVVLDIANRSLTLYDSLYGRPSHDALVDEKVSAVVKFLPHVMESLGIFEGKGIEKGVHPLNVTGKIAGTNLVIPSMT